MFFLCLLLCFCFFHATATPRIYTYLHTLSLHDALPIVERASSCSGERISLWLRSSVPIWTLPLPLSITSTAFGGCAIFQWSRRANRPPRLPRPYYASGWPCLLKSPVNRQIGRASCRERVCQYV